MSRTRIAIIGCTGKMGRALVRLAAADPQLQVVAGISARADDLLGKDAGTVAGIENLQVPIRDALNEKADVAIDFTSPAGLLTWAVRCADLGVALVSGTTGLEEPHKIALREQSKRIPILWSPNMSVGVNVLLSLVGKAAIALGPDWECEIVEGHHNRKADAPSGTARALLEAVCDVRGEKADEVVRHGRAGVVGARSKREIGMHAVRMGGVVGDHDVHFATAGEIVTLRHHAETRDIFASGALRAAKWIAGKNSGLYSMQDVFKSI